MISQITSAATAHGAITNSNFNRLFMLLTRLCTSSENFTNIMLEYPDCFSFKVKYIVAKAAGSSNGRTPPFGGGYLGSSPSPAALAVMLR